MVARSAWQCRCPSDRGTTVAASECSLSERLSGQTPQCLFGQSRFGAAAGDELLCTEYVQKAGGTDRSCPPYPPVAGQCQPKFLHKRIRIDRKAGLVAEREDGTPLELEALSSGEQHELVLHYDLLFRVRPNTLVLIDEPELSLHVVPGRSVSCRICWRSSKRLSSTC